MEHPLNRSLRNSSLASGSRGRNGKDRTTLLLYSKNMHFYERLGRAPHLCRGKLVSGPDASLNGRRKVLVRGVASLRNNTFPSKAESYARGPHLDPYPQGQRERGGDVPRSGRKTSWRGAPPLNVTGRKTKVEEASEPRESQWRASPDLREEGGG